MMEGVAKFGAGAGASFVHPVALVALVVTAILILILSRKYIMLAVLCFVLLIPQGQQFYIGGVHLYVYRIVVLLGLIRVICTRGHPQAQRMAGGWRAIDTAFALYVLIQAIAFSLQYKDSAAFINQLGFVWDIFGGYFLLRVLVFDHNDISRALECLSYIFALIAASMLIEKIYTTNLFGYIGGEFLPEMRLSSVRSSGSFRHPLTAGTAGATAMPLFLFLWYRNKNWLVAGMGMISATIITITANSSGPVLAYAAGIFAVLLWPARRRMRLIRWAAAVFLLVLHLLMNAPVWMLIARIDLTGGSSSYHRANLIDQFIRNFSDWWLVGTPNDHTWGWFLWDTQNQYVSAGVEGGLGTLISFIAILVYGFSMIGNALKSSIDEYEQRCLWVIGASLFSYMIAFLGVNLFDQSRVLWLLLLAIISASTASVSAAKKLYQ